MIMQIAGVHILFIPTGLNMSVSLSLSLSMDLPPSSEIYIYISIYRERESIWLYTCLPYTRKLDERRIHQARPKTAILKCPKGGLHRIDRKPCFGQRVVSSQAVDLALALAPKSSSRVSSGRAAGPRVANCAVQCNGPAHGGGGSLQKRYKPSFSLCVA